MSKKLSLIDTVPFSPAKRASSTLAAAKEYFLEVYGNQQEWKYKDKKYRFRITTRRAVVYIGRITGVVELYSSTTEDWIYAGPIVIAEAGKILRWYGLSKADKDQILISVGIVPGTGAKQNRDPYTKKTL